MIVCVCMNPSLDQSSSLSSFSLDAPNRIHVERTDFGGKGVNTAVMLRRLGADVRLVFLSPEEGGKGLEAFLRSEDVPCVPVPCPGRIRTNMKIRVSDIARTVEINGDMQIDGHTLASAREAVLNGLRPGDWLLLNGSLPEGTPVSFYADLVRDAAGCRTVVDCDGESLRQSVSASPWMIKPNREEFRALTGQAADDPVQAAKLCREWIKAYGMGMILLSLGADGAVLVTESEAWFSPALHVPVRGTHGAGDSMLAALCRGLISGRPLPEALRFAVACANASVQKEGTGLAGERDAELLYPMTEARPLPV